jgi:photosystem II stability/assembly factor-like uncharacterized protein
MMNLLKTTLFAVLMLIFIKGCGRKIDFSFEEQTAMQGISIRGISVVNDSVVWISGSGGKFARTIDGGKSWQWDSVAGASNCDFRDIQAFNSDTALVLSAGFPARIYKTRDGGHSWYETYSDTTPGVFFDAMDFWNEKSGVAISDPLPDGLLLIETHDGGESWKRLPPGNMPELLKGEAFFAASGTCLFAVGDSGICFVSGGSAGRVFISPNGGKSWNVSNTPLLQGKPTQGIFSIAIFNPRTAFIVGGDYENPTMAENTAAYTTDGGRTWKLPEILPSGGFNSCVRYVPKTNGKYLMAVGTQGTHLSKDKGKTWQLLDSLPFHTLQFEKKGKFGWVAGSGGRVARIKIE